jgi:hypothetical protein
MEERCDTGSREVALEAYLLRKQDGMGTGIRILGGPVECNSSTLEPV